MNKILILLGLLVLFSFELNAQEFQEYIAQGDSCVEQRDFRVAINFYKRALEIKPERILQDLDEVVVLSKIAKVYTEIAEYQKAIEYLLRYIEKDIVKQSDTLLSLTYNSIF